MHSIVSIEKQCFVGCLWTHMSSLQTIMSFNSERITPISWDECENCRFEHMESLDFLFRYQVYEAVYHSV